MSIGEPIIAEILCNCRFDFIWIDGEHAALDRRDIDLLIMIMIGKGVAPFVRVPWNDPVIAKPVLEMGPAAIIFPFIKTVEEAKLAVASCKYPPKGIRGFGPLRAIDYGNMKTEKYLERSKTEPWVILQIEHIDAVNNLKKIIKIEGVDSIVVGSYDLSGSIGLLGQTRHPEVIKLLDKIADICTENDLPFGISMGSNRDDIIDWLKRGVNWMALDNDIDFLNNGGNKVINLIKELTE